MALALSQAWGVVHGCCSYWPWRRRTRPPTICSSTTSSRSPATRRCEAAHFQRDALIEARPQAIAQWLPQVAANAQAARIRAGYDNGPALGSQAADCAISSSAGTQYCYGTAHTLGLNMSQTLWSFQSFSQLKEANFQVAAAEASFQGAQESLVLRVAVAYFGILSAADQLATNRSEREAFAGALKPSQGARADRCRSAQRRGTGAGVLRCDRTKRHRCGKCAG